MSQFLEKLGSQNKNKIPDKTRLEYMVKRVKKLGTLISDSSLPGDFEKHKLTERSLDYVVLKEQPKDPYDLSEYVKQNEHLTFSEIAKMKLDLSAQQRSAEKSKDTEIQQEYLHEPHQLDLRKLITNGKFGVDKIYLTRSKSSKNKENKPPTSREVKPDWKSDIHTNPEGPVPKKYLCKVTRDLLVKDLPEAFKKIEDSLGRRGEKSRQLVFSRFVELENLISNAYSEGLD